MRVVRQGPYLIATFAAPRRVASWAIVGGALRDAEHVVWLEVKNHDLPPEVDPRKLLEGRLAELGVKRAVGLLTSRRLDAYEDVRCVRDGCEARAIATVGLGNALRAGAEPYAAPLPSTINVLCHVSARLSDEALLEALALATEAKTLAVREAEVPCVQGALPASGTGTDCVVVACAADGTAETYAGKHTLLGHAIGKAVHDAVARGAAAWKREMGRA